MMILVLHKEHAKDSFKSKYFNIHANVLLYDIHENEKKMERIAP